MPSGIPKNGINTGRIKKGQRLSPKTEFKKGHKPISPFKKGQIPWNFKGENVKYGAMHKWVKKSKGKTADYVCEICGRKQAQHWANKKHDYRRNLDDYMALCCSCHRKYDLKNNLKPDNKMGNNQFVKLK